VIHVYSIRDNSLVTQRVFSTHKYFYDGTFRSISEPFRRYFSGADREHNVVGLFRSDGQLFGLSTTSIGTLCEVHSHPREIIKIVLFSNAFNFLVCHNHPGGDATPSKADRESFITIKSAADSMLIPFEDSIVLGRDRSYFSFRAEEIRLARRAASAARAKIAKKAEERLRRGKGSAKDACLWARDRLYAVAEMGKKEESALLINQVIETLRPVVMMPKIRRYAKIRAEELLSDAVAMLETINQGGFPDFQALDSIKGWEDEPHIKYPAPCLALDFLPSRYPVKKG
jgi:hypothetical protein